MNTEQTIHKTVRNLQKDIDRYTVTTSQVQEAISHCNLPNWLKVILQWLAAWTLRKKGYFSFLKAYLGLLGTMLVTRPRLWAWIIAKLFEDDSHVGRILLAIVQFFDGYIDSAIFWTLTVIVFLVVIFNFIVEVQKNKNRKELATLLNEITFNPEDDWFDKKCNLAIKTLGSRYSSEINFKNPRLSNVYKALITPEYWDRHFKKTLEEFIKESKHLLDSLPDSTKQLLGDIETKIETIIDIYNKRSLNKYALLFEYTKDILGAFREIKIRDRETVSAYQYRKVEDPFKSLEDYEPLCQFTSYPVLYIKGDAGTGKTHLLADIVSVRMNHKMKSLLALGFDFTESGDVRNRLMTIWGAKGTWDDFLAKLNKIAELEKHRILIVIDGINEGLGIQLWPSVLGALEADILQYKNLGLVISARSFSNRNMLDDIAQGKATITLEGFKGMEDEAIRYLTGKFGIVFPNISSYKKEFSNPLFLKLYCLAYNNTTESIPKSFLDIVKNYLSKVNDKLADKYGYQAALYNFTQQIADELTDLYIKQKSKRMVKYQPFDSLLSRAKSIIPSSLSHDYLQDLVNEGVLMIYKNQQEDTLVDFNFDLVGDYLCAGKLIEVGWRDYIGRIYEQGIYEATGVLLPLLKGAEICHYKQTNIDQDYRDYLFVETLKQRFFISEEALAEIDRIKSLDINLFYEILPTIASHPECHGIIDSTNNELKMMSMVERDQKWSMHFTVDCSNPSRTELLQLSRWAASLARQSTQTMPDNVSFQIASMLCWGFSSPYRLLRDTSTKAAINLLQDKPNVLIRLIGLFDDVNDPYIQQRLYAVAHGCVFLGGCCGSALLGKTIYKRVFSTDIVRTDILLRDYARCSVDYIAQFVHLTDVDLSRIKPPYGVHFKITECPDRDTVEKRYRINEKKGFSKNAVITQNAILESMETEYSNGTGGYGDFGRYTFEASMHGWEENESFNASLLRNKALEIIFDKYRFDPEIYQHHDTYSHQYRGSRPVMERFGKKYQWIALYEILGLLQDNYLMESWMSDHEQTQCIGTWYPHVRDIDTTNCFFNYYNEDNPTPREASKDWLHVDFIPISIKTEDNWLKSKEGISKELVKETIEVKDEKGDSWIVLYGYNTMTSNEWSLVLDDKEAGLWEFIQAYITPRKQRNAIAKYIAKKGTQGREMPEYRNSIYELYYKDYYSSASYREYAEYLNMDEWQFFEDRKLPYQFSYRPYTCEGEVTTYRLSKLLFEIMGLKDGERIGEYVDSQNRVIAFDPSVNYQNNGQLVVRKKELIEALKGNGLSLVWPVLFEKQLGTSIIGSQFGGSAYLTERGTVKAHLRLYEDRQSRVRKRTRATRLRNYAGLLWYTITFNKVEKAKIQMKMKIAKMYKD